MKKMLFLWYFYIGGIYVLAQVEKKEEEKNIFTYNITNTGEFQYNISDQHEKDPKYVNLLDLETSLSTEKWWKNGLFEVSFWSVCETKDRNLANDELTFSNIEENNHWLICSKLGYRHTIKNFSLFAGIRNVNIDYFTSPYSSLFTNSSAGIFPTISLNYGVANYPLGALSVHLEYEHKGFHIKNSFYNNLRDINDKIIFKLQFDPKQYGYINLSQAQYTSTSGTYVAGFLLNKSPKESKTYSLYALAEQSVAKICNNHTVGLIGQFGYAPKNDNYCYLYYGGGLVISDLFQNDGKDSLGLMASRANTNGRNETTMELTYQYAINSYLSVQPAFHYIHNDRNTVIGLVRGIFTFGN